MADETRLEKTLRIARNQKNIRNIATSAHIHHGKCVAPKTSILLADGSLISAEQLFQRCESTGCKVRENSQEIVYDASKQGVVVFSLNKETGELEKKPVSHAWKLVGGNAIKVKLRNGLGITTTPEHKYLVLEDMEFVEKEAHELRLKDRIVCARRLRVESNNDQQRLIMEKLSKVPCYARLNLEFGRQLLSLIRNHGMEAIAKVCDMKIKSFYHGAWQGRYRVAHLLKIADFFGITTPMVWKNVQTISFKMKAKNTIPIKLPNDLPAFFNLAGMMFGDGTGHKFVVGKKELAAAFTAACKDLGIVPVFNDYGTRTPYLSTNGSLLYILYALFDYPLRKKSHFIHVGDFLSLAPPDCISSFLRGYFDCDGTVEESRRAISLTSVSPEMLHGVQLLLLRFGCVALVQDDTLYLSGLSARQFQTRIGFGVSEKRIKAEHLVHRSQGSVVIDEVPLSRKSLNSIRKVPMASIDHHYYKYEQEIVTPTVDTVSRIKQQLDSQGQQTVLLDKLLTGDLAFIEVSGFESVHEPVVYDFSVPDHKNFVAEGMVIHNTALTDNLLAASGFMSQEAAGSLEKGMATWQHADEQERLMTVDAANVSMVHGYQGEEYLINLIDTPGHVDFGGNVTRAMRAIDGTIVLVCASEGIMPQTETVIKQALRERVKPVLFINKVDRLIKEMQFTSEQIQQRLAKLIIEFNRLIEQIAEQDFKEKWKVNIADGSVAFGSARDNWALSIPFMQKKNVSFKDILNIYNLNEKDRQDWVWKNAPCHEVILDMAIKHLPDPVTAQQYRIPKIWRGDPESSLGKSLLTCDPKGKVAFVITRVLIEPKSGREICAGRLYSGTIKEGTNLYFNMAKTSQRIGQVFIYQGIKPELAGELPGGNVLAVGGISGFAGETITEEPDQPFEELKHIFEPVITKAITAAKPQDLSKLIEVLRKVGKEDPSVKIEVNQETGECLIHGMGELHLEIIENRIVTEKGVQIKTTPPIVTYRETITKKSAEMEGKSPNKHNKLYFTVEPLEPHVMELIKTGNLPEGRIKKKDLAIRDALVDVGYDNDTALSIKDVYKGNVFMDHTRGNVQLSEAIQLVIEGFEQVCDGGPLAREPCFGMKVILHDAKLHEDAIHRGPAQMYPAVREGIKLAMMNAAPVLFEPMQTHLIEAPIEFTGEITKLVMNKRGMILEINDEGTHTNVKSKLPVMEMLGWSSDLRSATNGRGSSSLMDQVFERMPIELAGRVIQQIIKRKGLTAGMLGA